MTCSTRAVSFADFLPGGAAVRPGPSPKQRHRQTLGLPEAPRLGAQRLGQSLGVLPIPGSPLPLSCDPRHLRTMSPQPYIDTPPSGSEGTFT